MKFIIELILTLCFKPWDTIGRAIASPPHHKPYDKPEEGECAMPKNNSCVTLRGRLCGNPSFRTYESGHKLCAVNIAMDDDFQTAKGDWVERTVFIHTQAWNDLATRIENLGLGQGDMVSIQGQLQMVPATDEKPQWHKLRLDSLRLIERRGERRQSAPKPAEKRPSAEDERRADDDLGPASPPNGGDMDDVPF